MRNPLNKSYRITSSYGMRTLGGTTSMHNGIDLVPLDGKHPCDLVATVDGTISEVRSNVADSHTGLYVTTMQTGNFVKIKTKDGYTIIYYHLKAGSVIHKVGQAIKTGDKIGIMGTTGQSTGVHLHYEIRDPKGNSINPIGYLDNNVNLPSVTTVVTPTTSTTNSTTSFVINDKVKVKANSKWSNGVGIASFVFNSTMWVTTNKDSNNTVVISTSKGGPVTGRIHINNLTKM